MPSNTPDHAQIVKTAEQRRSSAEQEQALSEQPAVLPVLAHGTKAYPQILSSREILQLQRTIGNQATQNLLKRQSQSSQKGAGSIQRRLEILHGAGAGDYQAQNGPLNALLGTELTNVYQLPLGLADPGVVQQHLPVITAPQHYQFNTIYDLLEYMTVAGTALPAPVVQQQAPMALEFNDGHGDLHFGGDPTANKSKWSISKEDAIAIMETRLRHFEQAIRQNTPGNNRRVWILTGNHGQPIGRYKQGRRPYPTTQTYQIQSTFFPTENRISYHGYPDENVVQTGLGTSRNQVRENW